MRRKVLVTGCFALFRLERDYEGQCLVLALVLCVQLLDVWKGFGIRERWRLGWYIELEGKCVSPGHLMQWSGCELHVRVHDGTEQVLKERGPAGTAFTLAAYKLHSHQ